MNLRGETKEKGGKKKRNIPNLAVNSSVSVKRDNFLGSVLVCGANEWFDTLSTSIGSKQAA